MKLKFFAFILLSTFAAACGDASNTTTNANTANTNAANTAPANAVTYSTPTQEPTTNNAPTLTPVVRGYYDALKNKDSAALKMVLSADFVRSIEADMKEEKKTDMATFLAETDTIPVKPIEVRNEKIQGEKAVAEIRGGAYPSWTPIAFVKEGGAWKLTNESPAIENVSNTNK